jgi:hypothetical protein
MCQSRMTPTTYVHGGHFYARQLDVAEGVGFCSVLSTIYHKYQTVGLPQRKFTGYRQERRL